MRRISNGTTLTTLEAARRTSGRSNRIRPRGFAVAITIALGPAAAWFLGAPAPVQAQQAPAPAGSAAAAAPRADSLARFVAKDRLVLFIESRGLSDHAEAWQKTNVHKLLVGTPLGSLLESVAVQYLDQALTKIGSREKVAGSEIVALLKHIAQHGWAVAIHTVEKGPRPYRVTLVFEGAASKSLRPIASRVLGLAMGDVPPRLVKRPDRTLIAVDVPAPAPTPPATKPSTTAPANPAAPGAPAAVAPAIPAALGAPAAVAPANPAAPGAPAAAPAPPKAPPRTWIWWPEQNDLVVGIFITDDGAQMLDAIDGKVPPAAADPEIAGAPAEADFQPISTRYLNLVNLGAAAGQDPVLHILLRAKELTGASRIVQRLGLDDDALVTRTKLVPAEPRAALSALFDAPAFPRSALIPMPDGVNSFAAFSIKTEKLLGLVDVLDSTREFRTKLDEFTASLKERGRVDLESEVLARIGPKMAVFLSPVQSAAAEDEVLPLQSIVSQGINLTSLMAVARPYIPEATFVAEIQDPPSFIKALDGFIIALNYEIKIRAAELEKEAEAEAAARRGRFGGDEPGEGRRNDSGSDRSKTRKKAEIQMPKFNLIASPAKTRKFQLSTPTGSKLRLGPTHFRPVIYMDGKYLVVSASAGSAEVAIAALARQDWKPPAELARATAALPNDVKSLIVFDSGRTTPPLLAGLPAFLQNQINAGIALSTVEVPGVPKAPAAAAPPFGGAQGRDVPRFSGKDAADDEMFEFQARNGVFNNQGPTGPAARKAPPQTIRLQVEPDQLPKPEDLQPLMFPTALAITGGGDGILLTQRSAFPDQLGIESNALMLGFLTPAVQAALIRFRSTTAPPPAAAGSNPQGGRPPIGGPNQNLPRRRNDF